MTNETQPQASAIDALSDPFSVVLTSCNRFTLLRETVASLLAHLDEKPEAFIVIEDSGLEEVRTALAPLEPALGKPFEIIINAEQLGQMRAIDKAYRHVRTPLVFHCEDDWEFFRTGFLRESRRVLAARPDVSMVGLRPRSEFNPRVRETAEISLDDGHGAPFGYLPFDPRKHPEYFSYSFNPGLRRLADFKRFQPVARLGKEEDVSYYFKRAGFRMANLAEPAVRHLGDGAHVDDPDSKKKAKTLPQRLSRSIQKRIKRVRRLFEQGPV
ncbi:MAG: glycosyltransferase family 2 protein [Neomegalonema sp.]|nr:glycosyltransferase family 2 protein [Neomegalonema sp.]